MKTNKKPKSKQGFALEDRLLLILKKTVPPLVAPTNCDIFLNFTKLQVGMIIPDLVVIAAPKDLHQRLKTRRVPSLFECAILAELLQYGPCTQSQIARRLYARISSLDKSVSRLNTQKLLSIDRDGRLKVNRKAFPLSVKVISIEAKLRRWKDAILQAEEYLRFSNSSYVALPKAIIESNVRIRPACRAKGIGLIAVNSTSTEVILRPKSAKPLSAEWVWIMRKTASKKSVRRVLLKPYLRQTPHVAAKKLSKAFSQDA